MRGLRSDLHQRSPVRTGRESVNATGCGLGLRRSLAHGWLDLGKVVDRGNGDRREISVDGGWSVLERDLRRCLRRDGERSEM
jgi:hypothetical protein